MKKLFLITGVVFILSSCSIYRTISFNADHSGSIENKIDMSSMMAMLNETGGGGGMGNFSDLESLDKSKKELESIPGISNVKVSYDTTGIMYSSYDFNSTETLTKAMNTGGSSNGMMMGIAAGSGEDSPKPKMTYKGKKFFWEEIDKKSLKKMQGDKMKKELGEMDMILASSTMNTTITFPSAVKKVSYKTASITNDKTINYVMPIKDFISKNYKPLVVNLK
jgi:hypothetical protein